MKIILKSSILVSVLFDPSLYVRSYQVSLSGSEEIVDLHVTLSYSKNSAAGVSRERSGD